MQLRVTLMKPNEKHRKWKKIAHLGEGRKVLHDPEVKLNGYLYHFLPWPFAKMVFERNTLRLSPINQWQDPYEGAWCKLLFEANNKLGGVNAYGLCWTKNTHDEPFWRAVGFKKEDPIVRIKCRAGDLLAVCKSFINNMCGSMYLGKVEYVPLKTLLQLGESALKGNYKDVSAAAGRLLLNKRKAFAFENEVRLMWFDRNNIKDEILIPFDSKLYIKQVMISPHTSKECCIGIAKELERYDVEVKQSTILDAARFTDL